ncbi:MAG: DEAD/DEAH box helicase [Candidatus Wallbacteria bacterium]|nr:DEAD/DEAH box helicase [Candidatus Wallbacteria bacterium]
MPAKLEAIFHPLTASWFLERFGAPTAPQAEAWPLIARRQDTLVCAPTGSGKTLAAFLAAIDELLRESLGGTLGEETRVVYVSPLKALSNDVQRNLEEPLEGISELAAASGFDRPQLRALVRTGDTPARERQAMSHRPPHILVTTPESLYLLLTSARGRESLRTVRTVIVDEIHALVRDKRGAHLALSLERLESLCASPPARIGLSATVRPAEEVARFLIGAGRQECAVVDRGHGRDLDLGVEVPPSELAAVCTHEQWGEVYAMLAETIRQHRSTLVFVNTRRMAERVGHQLQALLGADAVASHHGSLSRDRRLDAEERLKRGALKAIVATASLELGIDIGYIDLVCQIGAPRSISGLLQRVGRSGHSLGKVPKGRLYPLTRDELMDCLAAIRAVRRGVLDRIEIPEGPLDILAQQAVAELAGGDRSEDELYTLFRRAFPYRQLARADFDAVIRMMSDGIAPGKRSGALLHRDAVNGRLRARRAARIVALTSGGAIPENADYRVVTAGDGTFVGTVNEDFAVESLAGDVFLLGNASWRIRHVRAGQVVVDDAQGAPATVPFWLGEAPARTRELSAELAGLREELAARLAEAEEDASAVRWLGAECGAGESPARQAARYARAQLVATGFLPSARQLLFERFFDESGGMQLVVHSPLGGRVNRAWGLAMRKRFCRSYDFELQAAATDNGVLLSMGPQHSANPAELTRLVASHHARETLVQALLAAPMFQTRWRWNATRALAVLRQERGKKVPPPLQRFRSDDLLTAVFPLQTACFENRPPDVPVPAHPLVRQTVADCLHEAMDVDGWVELLRAVESGAVELVARDTTEPSPFAHEILNSMPYTFLDDAPLEERRARAVAVRRTLTVETARDLGELDPRAIERVVSEAWPLVRDADELHDALLSAGALPEVECSDWRQWLDELTRQRRAARVETAGGWLWVSAEKWSALEPAFPGSRPLTPLGEVPVEGDGSRSAAVLTLARGRLELKGPQRPAEIGGAFGLPEQLIKTALEALEGEGFALQGRFRPGAAEGSEWCERRLLARVHRLTLDDLRRQIQPATPRDFWRFLTQHQHAAPNCRLRGARGARAVVEQLQGFEVPAGAWEPDLLAGRVEGYGPAMLDELCMSGEVAWGRLAPPRKDEGARSGSGPLTRVVPVALALREALAWLLPADRPDVTAQASVAARRVLERLRARGALFYQELLAATGILPAQLDDALSELAALGLVSADGFAAIRELVSVRRAKVDAARRRRARSRAALPPGLSRGGRWASFPGLTEPGDSASGTAARRIRQEPWCRQLLLRYGVLFRDLLQQEPAAPAWSEMLPELRRLEARGEIRGGRFVAGVGGEQFAATGAVERLRELRDAKECPTSVASAVADRRYLALSAADPLNLTGILTAGPRVPATRSNRLLFSAGKLVASLWSGNLVRHDESCSEPDEFLRLKLRG